MGVVHVDFCEVLKVVSRRFVVWTATSDDFGFSVRRKARGMVNLRV
jgi:hypothetical protein